MEVTGIRQPRVHLGTEKLQMLDLNKRLETYLGRVKFLEEENEFLKEEIQALRESRDPQAWKRELEGMLGKARGEIETVWRERDRVELEVGNLSEELKALGLQRQREAVTQAEAKKMLVESKKQLEEERRAQIWLREKTAQLEMELELHVEIHQEDVSVLQARLRDARPVLTAPPRTEVFSLQDLGHDYSQRAAQTWQEAAAAYQDQTRRLEDSLLHARAHMTKVTQDKRDGCLMVQCLAKELDVARNRKKVLEHNVSRQKDKEFKEIEQLQAHLESLEGEKVELGEHVSDILEESRKLLQLKMSLGLEVATYRALLDNESLRVNKPSINDPWGSRTVDGGSSPRGAMQRLQTTQNGSYLTSPVSIKLGKRTQAKTAVMAMTSLRTPQDTPEHKPKTVGFTEEGQASRSLESSQPAIRSTEMLNGKGSIEPRDKEIQEEASHAAALAAPRAQELGAIASLMDDSNIDQAAIGDSDVSMEEMRREEEGSHITEPEKYTGLNSKHPLAEQESTVCHSNVFSTNVPSKFHAEIEEHTSHEVTLDLLEEAKADEPHDSTEDCEDMGMEVSLGRAPESLHTPLFAWGEKEMVTESEEIEWTVGENSEFGLGSDVKEIDCAFEFGKAASDYSNLRGFKPDEQNVAKFESTMPLKATPSPKELLRHGDEEKRGQRDEHVSGMENTDDGDDLSDECTSEEPLEVELVSEEDIINAWDEENECEGKADSTNESRKMGHDSGIEQRETSEGISEVMERSSMEQNEQDLQTEKEAISADECPILDAQIDGNERDVRQEQTASDAERLDLSEGDKDESLTPTHSWRTDGGEQEDNDSYTLENTLADTRPLIRYQSDEADMNTQASHLGDSDSSADEGNDDRMVGAGFWGEDKRRVITSKSVEFMEDLDEEPERDTVKEEAAGEPYQREEIDASPTEEKRIFTEDEDDGSDRVVKEGMPPLDDETTHMAGPAESLADPMENSSEVENDGDLLSLDSNDNMKGESVDSEAALGLQTDCRDNEGKEIETFQPPDPVNSNMDVSSQSHSDAEEEVRIRSPVETFDATSSSSPSVLDEPCKQSFCGAESGIVKMSPEQNMNSDESLEAAAHTEETEVISDKREEEVQNLSMLTNVDFADELSLHSEPSSTIGSLANAANSDLDASYSSEDDSPNASQFSQPFKQAPVSASQEDSVAGVINSKLYEGMDASDRHCSNIGEPLPENATEEASHHTAENDVFLQDRWEVLDSPSAKLRDPESFVQSVGNVAECSQMSSYNEENIDTDPVAEEVWRVAEQPSRGSPKIVPEEENIFKVREIETPPQTNSKCNDLHNLLSTTLHEHTWSSSMKTGAAYDPRKCEQYDHVTTHTNQNLPFGVEWGETENLLGANGHTEGGLEMTQAPSLGGPEKIPVQVKQLLCGKMEEDGSHSEDSLEEGDSWSSGEE